MAVRHTVTATAQQVKNRQSKLQMKRSSALSIILALALILLQALPIAALDLPVKWVNGKQYYYHKVNKGESLYGISKHLGLTVEEIISHNPAMADGVKKGDILVFPIEEYSESEANDAAESTSSETDAATVIAESVIEEDTLAAEQPSVIGLMLPFPTTEASGSRSKMTLEFYRGFLVGLDSLSKQGGDRIEVKVYNTDGLDADAVAAIVKADSSLSRASVIIAPEDAASINAIARATADNGTYILNVFNTRDSLYLTDERVLQANVTQKNMYRLAVDAIFADFPDYKPVILRNGSGSNDREAFVTYFNERCSAQGIVPIEIKYDGTLVSADLESLPINSGEKYLFLPSGASVNDFNHIAYTLRNFREKLKKSSLDPDADGNIPLYAAEAAVFGYPDWTAFRGEALELLHKLEATVYSRFFNDSNNWRAKAVDSSFRQWYGTGLIDSVPVYGLLGFDMACFLVNDLRRNNGEFDPQPAIPYSGIQSTFDFEKSGEGYVDNAIYIINFQAEGGLSAHVQ